MLLFLAVHHKDWLEYMRFVIKLNNAVCPARIGSQEPEIMCQLTGIDVSPNVTAHLASPCTGKGGLYMVLFSFLKALFSKASSTFLLVLYHTH